MAVNQLHIQNDNNMGPPIYRPGIDMGEIDALSRMRDDETKDSARIKASCPGLTPVTQIHIASPAVDELFRLCDPARMLDHECDHHIAYMQLHALLIRRSASTDMGPCIGNGVGPDAAADDTRDALQRPNVYVTDFRRDKSVAPERRSC